MNQSLYFGLLQLGMQRYSVPTIGNVSRNITCAVHPSGQSNGPSSSSPSSPSSFASSSSSSLGACTLGASLAPAAA
eukprot:CAMPEP_0113934224 /NCGR_PEP_ID=MMETSP1339-20121228/1568_1 /TAXON_ID=94617 /ORGANISM="Fibrocapsa japonica" /LENGTH=75 /DNA_ID=CAMNT_0000935929 /DNA_START=50 /DNA_END=274 /DNA_ORIENTATION=+ /assembly_acc=CAM_ASM_000762